MSVGEGEPTGEWYLESNAVGGVVHVDSASSVTELDTPKKPYEPMASPELPREVKDELPEKGKKPSVIKDPVSKWPEFNRGKPYEPIDPGESVFSD